MSLRWLLLLWLSTVGLRAFAAGDCFSFTHAGEKAGQKICITGIVVEVHTTRSGVTYLNFCRDYRDCGFSIVVFPHDRRRLGNVRILQGREIRITGKVEKRNGRAQMAWHDPNQLVVAVGDAPSNPPSGPTAPASPQSSPSKP
jgi:hypothetical protein